MLLSARILTRVSDVNQFEYAENATFTQGDSVDIYIQLVDASADMDFNPPYRRFVPEVGATLTVKLQSVDSAKTVERNAVMAFPNDDRSIWRLSILATDAVVGTRDMKLSLNEGGQRTYGYVKQALSVHAQDGSF